MNSEASHIFDAALALPKALRAALAAKFLESIGHAAGLDFDDADFEDVLAGRRQELHDGTVKTYTADETIAAMREAIAKRSRS